MTSDVDRHVADLTGPARLPRKNGELVFNEPWEGRIFGLALALRSRRSYPWSDFRDRLEKEIALAGPQDDGGRYYQRWLGAFETLLVDKGVLGRDEVDRRTWEYREGLREEVF